MLEVFGQLVRGERPAHERVNVHQAAVKHCRAAARRLLPPGLKRLEREHGGVGQVPHLMSQEPEALGPVRHLSIERGLMTFEPVFGDGIRDGVVQALVQRLKIVGADGGIQFPCHAVMD